MSKILWKRGESPLFHNIFYLLLDFHVYAGTRFSLRDKRLFEISEFEITRVNCMSYRPTLTAFFPSQNDNPVRSFTTKRRFSSGSAHRSYFILTKFTKQHVQLALPNALEIYVSLLFCTCLPYKVII